MADYSDGEKFAYYSEKAAHGTPRQKAWAKRRLAQLGSRMGGGKSSGGGKKKYSEDEKRAFYIERLKNGTPGQKRHAKARLNKLGQGAFDFI